MKALLLARVNAGAVAVLAVLTLSACLLVGGLPRAMQASFDDALRKDLRAAGADQIDLTVRYEPRGGDSGISSHEQFTQFDKAFRDELPPALSRIVTPPGAGTSHLSLKSVNTPMVGTTTKFLNVGWLSNGDRQVTWVEGRAPAATKDNVMEIGVARTAVGGQMGFALGATYRIGATDPTTVKVVGVFEPKRAEDPYWRHNQEFLQINEVVRPGAADADLYYTALIDASSLPALQDSDRRVVYAWIMGVEPGQVGTQGFDGLLDAMDDFTRELGLISPSFSPYVLDTRLKAVLESFMDELATAQTILYLLLGGLLVVALGVAALATQLVTERLDPTLSLMRARGGSLARITWTGTSVIALATLPAALIGYGLSYLVPGGTTPIVHLAPALVPLTALAFAAVRQANAHRSPLNERRGDVASPRPSARRVTLEILVIGLALGGAYMVRSRGLATDVATQGQDPFLLLVPVALTLAAALITLRCYPYPLRLVVRLASRGRPAVPFLGLTRAARARSFSTLPVLILLPALAVAVFASVISTGLTRTQTLAAWQAAGAPITMRTDLEYDAAAIERIKQVPGVETVVPAQTGRVQLGIGTQKLEIIAIDLAAYRDLAKDSPLDLPAPPTGDGIPALVSPDLRDRPKLDIGWQSRMTLTPKGEIASVPGFFHGSMFALVPFDANERAGTRTAVNALLIKGDADVAALTAAAKVDSRVTTYAQRHAAIVEDPLTEMIQLALLVVTLALAAYAIVAVIVSLVISAADRAAALSFLRTLGLSTGQAQRLTVLEVSPLIVITALVGLGLGLGLPAALGPGIDLSSYAGDLAVDPTDPDLLTPILLGVGLTVVAILGALVHTTITRRRTLGSVLRVGD
ncbi:FtsX-like permease family protein [Nonomuraea sp. NPDC050310]|uniref:FtsX-like permease family protein n=1 Tax=Nonomuraea sp. NPDC050310 TaxID=3154935 RepID=UPI0034064712